MRFSNGAALLSSVLVAGATAQSSSNSSALPVVDLGYELHQAAFFNSTGNFYNFSNIRYAAPPIGDYRWMPPQPPAVSRSAVETGMVGRICPQASPAWLLIAAKFVPAFLTGQPFNLSSATSSNSSSATEIPAQDPRTTEDCLFLDVLVPEKVFESAGKNNSGAPVLVWIYGGGYTAGEKSAYNGAGLLERSEDGIIFVSLNYRLGAFGWLSGPTLQSNGSANAGLLDQRFALEWVQKNIHLFGGNPNNVTVMGESAGGGSILHQITAYGGNKGPAPFQQAIMQSPGFAPVTSNYQQEQIFDRFLSLLNVSSLQEARRLSSRALITANIYQVGLDSPYGTFTYGPVVDGDFAPALPGQLLLAGKFDKTINVMTGHNTDEGLLFTSPTIQNTTTFEQQIQTVLPNVSPAVLQYVTQELYPPVFNGSYGYTSQLTRAVVLTSELSFTCNNFYADTAYNNKTFSYLFSVPPGTHGQDVPYTFYNDGGQSTSITNATVATTLQTFITSFAKNGVPSSPPGVIAFPRYGPNATVVDLNQTSITLTRDPTANLRCRFWQKALFD